MPRRAPACEHACPLVSMSIPACARMHRRTAVRVPSPHVAVSTLAAAPQWPSAVGYSVSFAVPPRVLVLCEYPARPLLVLRADHASRRYFDRNSLDGTIPAALSALKLLQILCVRPARHAAQRGACVRCRLACAQFTCGRHGWASRAALGYAAPWVPPAACGLQGGRWYCLRTPR
jgi:hypothetical protein